MIHHVEGTLRDKTPGRVVVDVGGVGLEVSVTSATWHRVGEPGDAVRLLTHLAVREDAWTLFGFLRDEERQLYRLLLGVQGVGPRTALGILSGLPVATLRTAVAEADVKTLSTIPGIGRKIAQRLIVDLREKVGELVSGEFPIPGEGAAPPDEKDDAVDALVALGYPRGTARDAVRVARRDEKDLAVEDVVKDALRRL
ncbi:MAG: Holliday junction branch migration protein RuvA [bacterium]